MQVLYLQESLISLNYYISRGSQKYAQIFRKEQQHFMFIYTVYHEFNSEGKKGITCERVEHQVAHTFKKWKSSSLVQRFL